MAYMYILKCSDDSYYVGSTRNLEGRLWQHRNGQRAKYTQRRLPVELVYYREYETVSEAFGFEKQVQGWSRAKREALINNERHLLPELSRKHFPRPDDDVEG